MTTSAALRRGWIRRHADLDAAFFNDVDRSGDCWLWTRRRSRGYGILTHHGRRMNAHRHAYEIAVGPVSAGMEVLHSCDNPPCVRPSHLRLGTHADNMADMVRRGRASRQVGEDGGRALLTAAQVREIRAIYRVGQQPSCRALGERYGVAGSTIRGIVIGKTWRHLLVAA